MLYAVIAFAFGGVLKGATGAGAPIIGVPALAMIYDVPFAVTVFVVPGLVTNIWQAWHYRNELLPQGFAWLFAFGGGFGTVAGTWLLANLPQEILSLTCAFVVICYVVFRLARSNWVLDFPVARRLALPVGFVAGALQGASGLSAPVSLSFLNAMRLERRSFIATVSVFFVVMSAMQIPALYAAGFMSWQRLGLSAVAIVSIFAAMPLGALLARRFSRQTFDRLVLVVLCLLALSIIVRTLT